MKDARGVNIAEPYTLLAVGLFWGADINLIRANGLQKLRIVPKRPKSSVAIQRFCVTEGGYKRK